MAACHNMASRVYDEEDTPDISTKNVPSIIEETEPAMLMADVFASPARQATRYADDGIHVNLD